MVEPFAARPEAARGASWARACRCRGGGGRIAKIPGDPRGDRRTRPTRRLRAPRGARAARVPAGGAGSGGAPRGRSPHLHQRPRRRAEPVTSEPLEIRRLSYADLPQVIAIERRAFPTPWSLAMFVLELSKPSGICLAALREGRIVGYLICSRYDTVWHVMNVAVDDRLRREGIASSAAHAPVRARRHAGRAVHARGAHVERVGDRAVRAASASAPPACAAATTTTTRRTP